MLRIQPLPQGMNTRVESHTNPEFKLLENWWPAPNDFGALEVVPGFDTLTNNPGGTGRLYAIAMGEKPSTLSRRYFVCGDTSTWLYTIPGATPTKVKGGLTTDSQFSIVSFNDEVYFFNGSDTPFKYDFTSDTASAISNMGLTQPTLGSAASAIGSQPGHVRGVVKYWVAYVSGTEQLALSDSFGTIDAEDGSIIDLTAIPTSSGKNRFLYRSLEGGNQPFFLAAIGDATTTTYSDNIPAVDLGAPPLKHGNPPPDGAHYCIVHFNRLWIAGMNASEVWWSDLNYPESFNGYSVATVWKNDGDEITGLSRAPDGVYVWKHNHIYKMIGRDPVAEVMEIVEVHSSDNNDYSIGCPSHWAKATYGPWGTFFYHRKGFYRLTPEGSVEYLSAKIEDELRDDIDEDYQTEFVCTWWQERRCFFASVTTNGQTYNDRTYLYYPEIGGWFRLSEGFTSFGVVELGTLGQPPQAIQLWAHRAENTSTMNVMRLDHPTATDFDGTAIVATMEFHPLRLNPNVGFVSRYMGTYITFETESTGSVKVLWDHWSDEDYANSATMSLVKADLNRWTRRVATTGLGHEMALKIRYDGGTVTPKIFGLQVDGNLLPTRMVD